MLKIFRAASCSHVPDFCFLFVRTTGKMTKNIVKTKTRLLKYGLNITQCHVNNVLFNTEVTNQRIKQLDNTFNIEFIKIIKVKP